MRRNEGYAVVVFNQMGGCPDLLDGDLHWNLQDAKDVMEAAREQTASVGRGETYRLAEVTLLDDEDGPRDALRTATAERTPTP